MLQVCELPGPKLGFGGSLGSNSLPEFIGIWFAFRYRSSSILACSAVVMSSRVVLVVGSWYHESKPISPNHSRGRRQLQTILWVFHLVSCTVPCFHHFRISNEPWPWRHSRHSGDLGVTRKPTRLVCWFHSKMRVKSTSQSSRLWYHTKIPWMTTKTSRPSFILDVKINVFHSLLLSRPVYKVWLPSVEVRR